MNTSNIKKVAPKARNAFIEAVSNRLNNLGLYADKDPAEVIKSGKVFQVNGRSFNNSILSSRNNLKNKVKQKGFSVVAEEANKHKKALTALEKKQSELREFDDKLKHYADMQIKKKY